MKIAISVQKATFDTEAEQCRLTTGRLDIGAVVSFTGRVRDTNERPGVTALTLEHFPGMTEKSLHEIALEAGERWTLQAVTIIHRVGRLQPGDAIVLVMTASPHRRAAFDACDFIMDYLKTRAPFWKKEHTDNGSYWVSERQSDHEAANRWELS
ncbi:molybdopterin synthase catalytic subunit MoaE [Salinicola acroporae]|uniref:Molybdopterin synthase catalytic subunit n=1 Tax=Salinicola acroporae TaxID=1541440 RepID=A0ABT6I6K4_9GAMM|nr:molybdopterin synthase catalytic subunit MoaE [Salinicola acroporae]MDH4573362.1 molybdopterin synthase catalytic subunit MoaE [Salinicola acroporae]